MNSLLQSSKATSNNKKTSTKHKSGGSVEAPIRTINQMYNMCKTYHVKQKYNGIEIGKMLVDDRSGYIYTKGIFGMKIVEAKFKRYDNVRNEIHLICLEDSPNQKKLILKCTNEELFRKLRDSIYNNRDARIIVGGSWSGNGDTYSVSILSRKQMTIK